MVDTCARSSICGIYTRHLFPTGAVEVLIEAISKATISKGYLLPPKPPIVTVVAADTKNN